MDAPLALEAAWYRTERDNGTLRLVVGGEWVRSEARRLDRALRDLDFGRDAKVVFDCG